METCILLLALALSIIPSTAFADAPSKTLSWYGFVLPFYSLASGAAESFSNPNQGAISAAANPALAAAPSDLRSTFQVAQSRFGLTLTPTNTVSAQIEMDFIDFTKSSPTTSANPRLRRAVAIFNPSSELKVVFGQEWDLISPLAPFTYNYVGHFFEAGDIGFMRLQLQALYVSGRWESAAAIGLPRQNSSFSEGDVELSALPTVAWRQTYHGEGWSAGFSALVASLRASNQRVFSGAASVFASANVAGWEFRSEAYLGRNTANLGMLGLSFCNATNAASCPSEMGAYVSGKKVFGATSLFLSVGGAAVLNNLSSVLPSYSGSALTGTGPGMESNWTAHMGGDYRIADNVWLWTELSHWNTWHHLAAGAIVSGHASAWVFQLGSQVNL